MRTCVGMSVVVTVTVIVAMAVAVISYMKRLRV